MAQKKRKSKISFVKRGNQLRTKLLRQGKLKTKRHLTKPRKMCRLGSIPNPEKNEKIQDESDQDEALNMIEKEDMSFLENAIFNKNYQFFNNCNIHKDHVKPRKLKRKAVNDLDTVECEYEQHIQNSMQMKKKKYLLPIKTSKGIIFRSQDSTSSDEDEEINKEGETSGFFETGGLKTFKQVETVKEISNADLLACRQRSLVKKKFRIGILCSGLTENPELKIKNFKPLLEMLSENDTEVSITVKKLALMSLLEVFKDLLPAYQIRHHSDSKVKLKKAVKQLHNYESELLKYYKGYLKEIEKLVAILKKKKGDFRTFKEPEIKLAEMGLQSLCDLLITHPYFNFSKNIVNLLVPFLNNGKESVRTTVSSAFKEIFKSDKRGEISLEIVRNINKLVKTKSNILHSEVLLVFLSLKLKDVNLEKEKREELKKKELAKKQKFIKMSKRERKRNKKFKELEKELLETKAEENKKSKEHYMTEITKILFTIYFRILKVTPSSKLLNATLEGLAKFAHCINIEFYQDLIIVLDNLIQTESLGYKEKLCCVQTVFTVLYYQGASICTDPIRFYSHFYANILEINAGKNHSDLPVILRTTDFLLLKRRKHVSLQKLLAFTKKLSVLALQILPNGTLAVLSCVKQILQVNNTTDTLLDFDSGQGQGVYYPELNEPEYCNASATSLWELFVLQKHYHPTVRDYATHIAKAGNKVQENFQLKSLFKLSTEQLFEQFDPSEVKFNPAVPTPRKFSKIKRKEFELLNPVLKICADKIYSKTFL